ncbi:hypothetical protein SAMN05518672_104382 [Chitinophaga sp. CF118]|nr:hypothetical protein SAMN05518672_104382 [Chitinophaga sp. CF118]
MVFNARRAFLSYPDDKIFYEVYQKLMSVLRIA